MMTAGLTLLISRAFMASDDTFAFNANTYRGGLNRMLSTSPSSTT